MKVHLRKLSQKNTLNICHVSKKVFDLLKLSEQVLYDIQIGQISRKCYIKKEEDSKNCMYIPVSIFKEFMLYDDAVLNIWEKNNKIRLGPVVGIFINPRYLGRTVKGDIIFNVRQHIRASISERCLGYYFSYNDIDWNEKKIKGCTFIPSLNKWEYRWFPMFDVLYDKGAYFKQKEKPIVRQLRRRLRNNNDVKIINSRNALEKWELFQALSKYDDIKNHIPETYIYSDFNDVLKMMKKHNLIFLKYIHGCEGRQVLSIEKVKKGYILNFYEHSLGKLKEVLISDVKDLKQFVDSYTEGREFIIQQGIRLLKFENRCMDLRLLMEKDEKGKWVCAFNIARIANGDSTITNNDLYGDNRGDFVMYDCIYPKLNRRFAEKEILPQNHKVVDITAKIAYCIEKELGFFGELGMDMAVDVDGKIWFIEANEKPNKWLYDDLTDLYGDVFINQLIEHNTELERKPLPGIDNFNGVTPQASAIFKYSKFLSGVN